MKYMTPVAERVALETVSALLASGNLPTGCCGDAVSSSTEDEEL